MSHLTTPESASPRLTAETGPDLQCPRCELRQHGYTGCATCAAEGVYVNLVPPPTDLGGRDLADFVGGPWGWRDTLSVSSDVAPVTLGEGDTPLIPLASDGTSPIWVKNEAANPTASHKDRGMSVAVAKALEVGADTIVAPSSGNAGLAASAYAARAGLRAVILTTPGIPPMFASMLATLGAHLVILDDLAERAELTTRSVAELGWYPVTFLDSRVGGNPFGNAGYKSIAYELARDLGDELAAVVVPTSRADLLSGVASGFDELVAAGLLPRMPRLVAAEAATGAAFSAALALDDIDEQDRVVVTRHDSPAFSIGSDRAHWQGLHAIRRTDGWAVPVEAETYLAEKARVGAEVGLMVETAAAVAIAAARRVAERVDGVTVALGTSASYKDPIPSDTAAAPDPVVLADLDRLRATRPQLQSDACSCNGSSS